MKIEAIRKVRKNPRRIFENLCLFFLHFTFKDYIHRFHSNLESYFTKVSHVSKSQFLLPSQNLEMLKCKLSFIKALALLP